MSKVIEMEGFGKVTVSRLCTGETVSFLRKVRNDTNLRDTIVKMMDGMNLMDLLFEGVEIVDIILTSMPKTIKIDYNEGVSDFPVEYLNDIYNAFVEVNDNFLGLIKTTIGKVAQGSAVMTSSISATQS